MASDILIVDDEADIRELVAGHPRATRVMARAPPPTPTRRWPRSPKRRPSLVFLDIWLQGSRLDGLALLDDDQGATIPTCRSS